MCYSTSHLSWRRPITSPHLLIFTLDGQRYALRLDNVERVIRAAAITPLPEAPEIVLGILDLQGEVIPVINLRKRFRLPERETSSADQFVVARTATLTLALVVDGTESVIDREGMEVIAPDDILTGVSYLEGVTRTDAGLILIHDLETLLFAAEEELLAQALERVQ
jgi:purine-binding chemotaxis protein CheW